ncbi:bacterial-type DNA primase [Cenarchaeum symbiosum A]|uniref:Bacterial-type DNA primase n=1 Tax=Cenarchaeum symbiosum (strain A) TaxID=414004 RepID=A0RTZ1_CENSY|nr:bacterial-type DNA primase [Cenarchaeum symbiosum A]
MSGTSYKYCVKVHYKFKAAIEGTDVRNSLLYMGIGGLKETALVNLKNSGVIEDIYVKKFTGGEEDGSPVWTGKMLIPVVDENYCKMVSKVLADADKIYIYERDMFDLEIRIVRVPSEGTSRPVKYKDAGLDCGPGASTSGWIILVDGWWDVLNMGCAGYDNAVAFAGSDLASHIGKITDICGEKGRVLAFLGGGRPGERHEKALREHRIVDDDTCRRAPEEVENLSSEAIHEKIGSIADRFEGELGIAKPTDTEYWEKPLEEVWPDLSEAAEPPVKDGINPEAPAGQLVRGLEPYTHAASAPAPKAEPAGKAKPGRRPPLSHVAIAAGMTVLFLFGFAVYLGYDVPLIGMMYEPRFSGPVQDDAAPGGPAPDAVPSADTSEGGRLGPDDPPDLATVELTRIAQLSSINRMGTEAGVIALALVDGGAGPGVGMPAIEQLCPQGSEVYYETDGAESDGQMIAKVWCTEKISGIPLHSINEILLDEGLAGLYKPHCMETGFGTERWARDAGC